MDKILIKDLLVRCTIGVGTEERREKEDVVINIVLTGDQRQSGKTDQIEDTVDYRALKKRVIAMVEKSRYSLIEALAERIASICLADPGVIEAQVTVEKPFALRFARSVGVEITRSASDRKAVEVFLGLGSNIDPQNNILMALERLKMQVRILAVSTFYQTQALGSRDNPSFINGVIKIETRELPLDLKYKVLRPIEEEMGRIRTEDKNAPRTIDIDILTYSDLVIKQEDLVIPDSEVSEREYLAVPLAELASDLILPGTRRRLGEYSKTFEPHTMKVLGEYSTMVRRKVLG